MYVRYRYYISYDIQAFTNLVLYTSVSDPYRFDRIRYGSVSSDPYYWTMDTDPDTDPDPDPALVFSGFQDANKFFLRFFCLSLTLRIFTSVFKDN